MIVHQRDFFSWSSSTADGMAVVGVFSTEDLLTNSPAATSSDVRPSSGTLGEEENHPPGKKREEVVDSSLLRLAPLLVGISMRRVLDSVTSAALSSSTADKLGLNAWCQKWGRK
ncbi:hypothetical protein BD769DRAFT_1366349 [Suillus cothurnatus]|nr:hypothetical protein BD769DRAFT_1366349 [Suillus cothurnatus]